MRNHYRILKTRKGYQLQRARSYFGMMGVWRLLANEKYVCETFPTAGRLVSKYRKILKGRLVTIVKTIDVG